MIVRSVCITQTKNATNASSLDSFARLKFGAARLYLVQTGFQQALLLQSFPPKPGHLETEQNEQN